MIKELYRDRLNVRIYQTRAEMGKQAAIDIKNEIKRLLSRQEQINMIFAAAPSQSEVLSGLVSGSDIEWSRINAFHMDEYVGLAKDAPQRFGNFLKDRLFGKLPFRQVFYIDGNAESAAAECERYAALLREYPADIICLGIGENGHIAFNDPWVADFDDDLLVKEVELDEVCRKQQVNDGCFERLDHVPRTAITLTIPALFAGKALFCAVPAHSKAQAVKRTVDGEITTECPASILRKHSNTILYCDSESGQYIL